jgi:hypothetical protein
LLINANISAFFDGIGHVEPVYVTAYGFFPRFRARRTSLRNRRWLFSSVSGT